MPGFEAYGGITQDIAVGGINPEAVKHMADMKGGYGRIVWLPTFDAQNQVKDKGPEVKVSENGKLLPSVLKLLDYIATRKQLALETGHISAEEALMVIKEARARGIAHIVCTHGMTGPTNLSVAQAWIKAVGPSHIILSTDLGGARPYPRPMPTAGLLEYMQKLHALGISVADLNTMAKTNPAIVLGLDAK